MTGFTLFGLVVLWFPIL